MITKDANINKTVAKVANMMAILRLAKQVLT